MSRKVSKPLRVGEQSNRLMARASEIQAAERAAVSVSHTESTLRIDPQLQQSIGHPHQHNSDFSWLPDKGSLVFLLIAIHLGALCYWCYATYISNRRARQNYKEPKTPPPRVNCTYDWATAGEADPNSKGFWSRFKIQPFIDRKDSGRPVTRSELASIGITGSGFPSRSRMTRTPTLPSTPELV